MRADIFADMNKKKWGGYHPPRGHFDMFKTRGLSRVKQRQDKQVYVKRSTQPQDGGRAKEIPHVYKQSTSSKPQKKIFREYTNKRDFTVTLRLNGPFLLRN